MISKRDIEEMEKDIEHLNSTIVKDLFYRLLDMIEELNIEMGDTDSSYEPTKSTGIKFRPNNKV